MTTTDDVKQLLRAKITLRVWLGCVFSKASKFWVSACTRFFAGHNFITEPLYRPSTRARQTAITVPSTLALPAGVWICAVSSL